MSDGGVRFETGVDGIWGYWPAAPAMWSYSTLKEIEECPRRWMLSRATYPEVWDRHGYPRSPVAATIFGSVVHRVVEHLTNTLTGSDAVAASPQDVPGVLSALGGWQAIVERAVEAELARLQGNPRATAGRIERLRIDLAARVPEAINLAKTFLGGHELSAKRGRRSGLPSGGFAAPNSRRPVGVGIHPEHDLVADSLRLTGTIDRLVVHDDGATIIDFKTGLEDESHDDQVRVYALLWALDRETNPAGRLATELRVIYATSERSVSAPDRALLGALERDTADRVAAADRVTTAPPPVANPSESTCRYCSVRHMCGAYWSAVRPSPRDAPVDAWLDVEAVPVRPNGSRSWLATSVSEPATELLVRTITTDVAFPIGQRSRILGVKRSDNVEGTERPVISMTPSSEWYSVTS